MSITAFLNDRIVARGSREAVTRAIEERWPDAQGEVRVFDDADGRSIDLDLWDASARAPARPAAPARGRPRLGVVAREVTLLPRHWEWLAGQPGGASATLRRLVDAARRQTPEPKAGRDAAYRFLTAIAGDRPGYEEALRALYRGDLAGFRARIADWPRDVRDYADHLLGAPAELAGAAH